MNKSFLAVLLLTLLIGCSPTEKKDNIPPPPAAETPASEPAQPAATGQQPKTSKEIVQGYEKGLVTSMDKARLAQTRTDLGAIKDAVANYQVDNGKYPASLDDIKSNIRTGADLGLFAYDAATGDVTIK